MSDLPRYGDRVLIPWFGREDEARVLDVYESVGKPYLLLEVAITVGGEPVAYETYSLPASWVRRPAVAQPDGPV